MNAHQRPALAGVGRFSLPRPLRYLHQLVYGHVMTNTSTDADILAAIDRGIAAGDFIKVTPEMLAEWAADAENDTDSTGEPVEVNTYQDVMGRTQHSVTGPRGHLLITRDNRTSAYTVWRSDSIRTLYRSRNIDEAIRFATRRVA